MNTEKTIRVRFAPSPTGSLHIGSIRTAIFNYLYAGKYGGKFCIRIEDTDRERSRQEYVQRILTGLKWLGLDWDGEPVYQSTMKKNHVENVERLVREGKAYYCYDTPEDLERKRNEAQQKGLEYHYDRKGLSLTPEEREALEHAGAPKVVRFLVPPGSTVFTDAVHGRIEVQNREIDDFILLRSDGSPTYHIAVVSDDHTMEITHVIRGDDHLSNTPKQILLFQALGFDMPYFAHIPLIFGQNKKKLSKRFGAVGLHDYRERGFLPECLLNFLTLLGWSSGTDQEIFSREELLQVFDLDRIAANNAMFDEQKLEWMNGHYITARSADELWQLVKPFFTKYQIAMDDSCTDEYIQQVIELLKSRMRRLEDFVTYGRYFFQDPSHFDEKALKKHWKESTSDRLSRLIQQLESLDEWTQDSIEQTLRTCAESLNISAAKLIHPARLALTGFGVSPGIFEVMELLQKTVCIRRMKRCIDYMMTYGQTA